MSSEPVQVFVASTAYGLATLVAALDDDLFPAGRRILITSNNAATPETSPEIAEVTGTAVLLERFEAIHSYNAAIAPQHPTAWAVRAVDLPIWERFFRTRWDLGDAPVRLIMESLQAPPAHTLAQIFAEAAIDVYADGLMCYGPTRIGLPGGVVARIERLLYLDLLPGVVPLLLQDVDVPSVCISNHAFTTVVKSLGPPRHRLPYAPGDAPYAILLGQYLAAAGLLSEQEEVALHRQMITGAVAAGYRKLIFKPHPSAPSSAVRSLRDEAARVGADLYLAEDPALVETWFGQAPIGLVVGCFSTGLLTARTFFGLPVARTGTELVLRRLRPYANSNRIPAVVVDATVPDLAKLTARHRRTTAAELTTLIQTVGFCMQPERYPALRPVATAALQSPASDPHSVAGRYVRPSRLAKLGLPGGSRRHPVLAALRRSLGADRYNRLARLRSVGRRDGRHRPA